MVCFEHNFFTHGIHKKTRKKKKSNHELDLLIFVSFYLICNSPYFHRIHWQHLQRYSHFLSFRIFFSPMQTLSFIMCLIRGITSKPVPFLDGFSSFTLLYFLLWCVSICATAKKTRDGDTRGDIFLCSKNVFSDRIIVCTCA